MIQRSPNHTRGRTPCAFSSSDRVSVACSNSGIRVSRHSSLPRKKGELAPSATCTPAIDWAAFQYRGNADGLTCRWNWTLVQAASGATVSAEVASRCTPSMAMCRSSPRAAKICSLSSAYRGLADRLSALSCFSVSVGRMPIITMWLPVAAAFSSAELSVSRTLASSSTAESPDSIRGATLISTLNWPSSVWKSACETASSTSALRIAGSPWASTRLSSISTPVIGRSKSNCDCASIRSKTSRLRRTFCR